MPQRRRAPRHFIINKLDFDKEQADQYLSLIKAHQVKMHAYRMEMNRAKTNLYSNLANEGNAHDSLFAKINKIQYKIEVQHYSHFQDIKRICRPDQLDNFEELSHELSRLFGPGPPPHGKNGRPHQRKK